MHCGQCEYAHVLAKGLNRSLKPCHDQRNSYSSRQILFLEKNKSKKTERLDEGQYPAPYRQWSLFTESSPILVWCTVEYLSSAFLCGFHFRESILL